MLFILASWWYGDGLKRFWQLASERMTRTADYFSIGLLLKTLFNPFRQISNVNLRPDAPMDVKFRAFGDKLLSRFIGAFMRTLMIIIGGICLLFILIFTLIGMILYFISPILPLIFIIMFFVGFGNGGQNVQL